MDEKFYDLMEKLYVELQNTKTELKEELGGVRRELKEELQGVRTELKEELQGVGRELKELNQRVSVIETTMATKEDLELLVEEVKHEIQIVHDQVVSLRNDFIQVEMATAKNSYDIARFKLARQN